MTNQEAIEDIKSCIGCGIYEETANMAIKSLEKQIPKKPYIQQVEVEDYDRNCLECPTCDSFIGYESECIDEHYRSNYCPNCGQALDWSE